MKCFQANHRVFGGLSNSTAMGTCINATIELNSVSTVGSYCRERKSTVDVFLYIRTKDFGGLCQAQPLVFLQDMGEWKRFSVFDLGLVHTF